MDEKKKKNRAANFSKTEVDLLCNLVIKYAAILESKKTDAVMWQQKLDNWNRLTCEFNKQNGGMPRTMLSLKTKYECIKKEIRKKAAKAKQDLYKTGGGTSEEPFLTPSEEKIYDLIFLSVEGLSSRHDDDTTSTGRRNEILREIPSHAIYNSEESKAVSTNEGYLCEVSAFLPILATSGERKIRSNLIVHNSEQSTSDRNLSKNYDQNGQKGQTWKKWDPQKLKAPVFKQLQARKKLLTKLEASEKVNIVAHSKKELIELQTKCLKKDMEFKERENDLKIKKLEEELKIAQLNLKIKKLEKEIKERTLPKILDTSL